MADRYGNRDDNRWRSERDWNDDQDLGRGYERSSYTGRSDHERDFGPRDRNDGRQGYSAGSYRGNSDSMNRYGTAWNRDDEWWRHRDPSGGNDMHDHRAMGGRDMSDRDMDRDRYAGRNSYDRDVRDRDLTDRMRQMGDRAREGWDRMNPRSNDRDRYGFDHDRNSSGYYGGSRPGSGFERGGNDRWEMNRGDMDRGRDRGFSAGGYDRDRNAFSGREDYLRGRSDTRSARDDERPDDRDWRTSRNRDGWDRGGNW